MEVKKFKKPFSDYDLAVKGWCEFKYKIECAPSWSEFDNELIVFSTRDNVKLLFQVEKMSNIFYIFEEFGELGLNR